MHCKFKKKDYTREKEHFEIWSYKKGMKCYSKLLKVMPSGTSHSCCFILWFFSASNNRYRCLPTSHQCEEAIIKAKCSSAASRKIFPQKLGSVYVVYETLLSPLLQCCFLSQIWRRTLLETEAFPHKGILLSNKGKTSRIVLVVDIPVNTK